MEKGSHSFGSLMQSVYHRVDAIIDVLINRGAGNEKVHTQLYL